MGQVAQRPRGLSHGGRMAQEAQKAQLQSPLSHRSHAKRHSYIGAPMGRPREVSHGQLYSIDCIPYI
jgi:hypothetical protein